MLAWESIRIYITYPQIAWRHSLTLQVRFRPDFQVAPAIPQEHQNRSSHLLSAIHLVPLHVGSRPLSPFLGQIMAKEVGPKSEAGSLWGRTDLGQPVRCSYIETTKLTDCIQTNSCFVYTTDNKQIYYKPSSSDSAFICSRSIL